MFSFIIPDFNSIFLFWYSIWLSFKLMQTHANRCFPATEITCSFTKKSSSIPQSFFAYPFLFENTSVHLGFSVNSNDKSNNFTKSRPSSGYSFICMHKYYKSHKLQWTLACSSKGNWNWQCSRMSLNTNNAAVLSVISNVYAINCEPAETEKHLHLLNKLCHHKSGAGNATANNRYCTSKHALPLILKV